MPVLELLESALSKSQYSKIKKLFRSYPQLLDGEEVTVYTKDIAKNTGIRSDNVIRDLKKIASLCGRLDVEPVFIDKNTQNVIDDIQGHEERQVRLGGRSRSRGVRLRWVSWNNSERKGFSGKSIREELDNDFR